jgi:phage terminase small subunit
MVQGMTTGSLGPQREAFLAYYLGGKPGADGFRAFNARRSALEAGYSPKNIDSQASQLIKHPKVAARIREALTVKAAPADAVLSELADVAFASDEEFLIVRYDPKTGGVVETRRDRTDKIKALELLGKHYQLFTDRLNVSGAITFADLHALAAPGAGADDPRPGE